MKESATIIEPGFYQMNMGGASLGECWRLSTNPIQFIIALSWKLFHKKLENYTWLPVSESIKYCDFDQFKNGTKENLRTHIDKASSLGFEDGKFLFVEKCHHEGYFENGGYIAIHKDKKRVINIAYTYNRVEHDNLVLPVESSGSRCIVSFCDALEQSLIAVHNDGAHFDTNKRAKVYFLRTENIEKIAKKAASIIHNYDRPIQSFRNFSDYDQFIKPIEDELWLSRINRGLFVKVPVDVEEKLLAREML